MALNRYSLTLDVFIFAENENKALFQSALFVESINKKHDNQAQVLSVDSAPFASLQTKNIHTGRLDIFEGELIQKPSPKPNKQKTINKCIELFDQLTPSERSIVMDGYNSNGTVNSNN